MKVKILNNAADMFLSLGFKSITMDDIARSLGVSKKTIYTHYNNKTELVEAVTNYLFDTICCGMNTIHERQQNPIAELFEIKKLVMQHLKDEKSSPQYQLQKYYPKIYSNLKKRQFEFMQDSIKDNLIRGINQKLYKTTINTDFVTRIYIHGIMGIKNKDIFPLNNYSMGTLMNYYLEYHLYGICTEKGIHELEKQLHSSQSTKRLQVQ